MARIETNTLIVATMAHILDRLKSIDSRLIDIEDFVTTDDLPYQTDVEDDTAAALADQLLDAADEIEEGEIVPDSYKIADTIRQIATKLAEAAE